MAKNPFNGSINVSSLINIMQEVANGTKTVKSAEEELQAVYKKTTAQVKQLSKVQKELNETRSLNKQLSELNSNLKSIQGSVNKIASTSNDTTKGVKQFNNELEKTNKHLKNQAFATESWSYNWAKAMQSFLTYNTVTQFFNTVMNGIKDMIEQVKDLDSALVELQKVTDLEGKSLDEFVDKAYEAGKTVAKTGTEMIEAATAFAKAGYNANISLELGTVAAMYTNIADEAIDAADAADMIIAQMKAFNITAKDSIHIIDAINEVSNNYAVSSADIARNLGKASAVMANAGNSMEQYIGLITAATEVTRNASKAANGLKTLTLRLQGMNDEGERDLEVQAQMEALFRKLGVSVYDANGELKNTYEILETLAPIYQDLTNAEKAYVTETIAGKYQAQNAAAILNNWKTAVDATTTAMNSNGSAAKENEKVLNSIQGKIQKLSSEWEKLSKTIFNSNFIKFFVDAGTTLLKFANSDIGQIILSVGTLVVSFNLLKMAITSAIGKKILAQVIASLAGLRISFVAAGGGAKGLAASMKLLASSVNVYLAAATAVVGIAVAVNNAYKNNIEAIKEKNEAIDEANQKQKEAADSAQKEVDNLKKLQSQLKDAKGNKSALLSVQKDLNKALGTSYNLIYDEGEAYKDANYLLEQQIQLKEKLAKTEKDNLWKTTSSSYKTQEYDAKNLYGNTPILRLFNDIAADDLSGSDLDIYLQSYYMLVDEFGEKASEHWKETWSDAGKYEPDFSTMQKVFQDRYDTMLAYFKDDFSEKASGVFDEDFLENALNIMIGKAASANQIKTGFETIFKNIDVLNEKIKKYQLSIKNGGTGEKEWQEFLAIWNSINTSSYPLPYILTPDFADTIYAQGQAVLELGDNYEKAAEKRQEAAKKAKENGNNDYYNSEIAVIDALYTSYDNLSDSQKKFYDGMVKLADSGKLTSESVKELMTSAGFTEETFIGLGSSTDALIEYFSQLNVSSSSLVIELDNVNKKIDEIQSAYETSKNAIEEYNKQGYFSIDTLQALGEISGDYLQYLFDENGQLKLNENSYQNLINAQLQEIKIKQTEQLLGYVQSLAEEGNQLDITASKVDNLTKALEEQNIEYAKTIALSQYSNGDFTEEELKAIENRVKQVSAFMKEINSTISNVSVGRAKISSNSTGNSSSKNEKEWWEKKLDSLKEEYDNSEIDIELYIKSLNNLLGKVKQGSDAWKKINKELQKQRLDKIKDDYNAGRISLNQYIISLQNLQKEYGKSTKAWNELAEAIKKAKLDKLKEQQNDLKAALSAVNKVLDDQIDKYKKDKEVAIESIEKQIEEEEKLRDATQDRINNYERAQQAILKYLNEQLDSLNSNRDSVEEYYDSVTEAIEKMNEEQEDALSLAEAYENLVNAMSNKSKKVYKEGLGWVWEADQEAIKDAKKTYEDLLKDAQLKDIEDQKDKTLKTLDEQIKVLEDYISSWEDVLNKFDDEKNKSLADLLLGENWTEAVSKLDLKVVTDFSNSYYNLQKTLEESEKKIEDLNNKKDETEDYWDNRIQKVEDYKNKWSEVTSTVEDEANKQKAAQILSANWEKNILNGRLDTLEKFKKDYNKITGEINNIEGMRTDDASGYTPYSLPGYANGGEVDYTGLAVLHGTPSRPEYVLNNTQMKNLLSNLTRPRVVSNINNGSSNAYTYNFGSIELPNVNNAQQFINELKSLVNTSKNL